MCPHLLLMAREYLKSSYKPQLWTVLAFNVVAFWGVIISHADLATLVALLDSFSIKDGLIGSIVPTVAFVLDALLSPDAKARIAYWRWNHPLPGSRAFSIYLNKEHRANPSRLEQNWGPFPGGPVGQNRLWYQIYKSFEQEIRVREAHRSWLFSRDLTAYTLFFLTLFGTAALFSDASWTTCGWYLGALTLQYALTTIAARSQGVRFVRQVLVIASQP